MLLTCQEFSINNNMAKKRNYKQGYYNPTNPEKYIGDITKIIYRSSWERQYFIYCDENSAILQWNSEDCKIPYISPLDNRKHNYHVDIYVKYKTRTGEIKQSLIEIKPHKETLMPKRGKKRLKTYTTEVTTYVRNQAKWKAATAYAKRVGMDFVVLTENELKPILK